MLCGLFCPVVGRAGEWSRRAMSLDAEMLDRHREVDGGIVEAGLQDAGQVDVETWSFDENGSTVDPQHFANTEAIIIVTDTSIYNHSILFYTSS